MNTDLGTLQATFARALLNENEIEPVLALFKGNPELNRERFLQCRDNLFANWSTHCAAAYPVTKHVVGEDFFEQLIRVYGLTHASTSGNFTEFGAALPAAISTLENCQEYPYLHDLAALEWQINCTYHSKQRSPATLSQLATYSPEELTGLRFTVQETCHFIKSSWSVADIWHAHQQNDLTLSPPEQKESYYLIRRDCNPLEWKVHVNDIPASAYVTLTALAAGATLGDALELALKHNPDFALQTELSDWFDQQLFCNIFTNEKE